MKKGLVLEGGAMRCLFTAGVLDVLMENNIEADGVIGVSAGAAFGCNFVSKQIGRTIRYNMKYLNDKRYCSVQSLIKTGDLYGAEFCYHTLPDTLDVFDVETFKKSNVEFYVVATDVKTGKAVYHKCTDAGYEDLEWIRASASMPLVSNVVEIDGEGYLDGGIAQSIPIKCAEKMGYNKNLVILTQPKGFVKKKSKILLLMKLVMRKHPKLVKTMSKRHNDYNETIRYIEELEKKEDVMVIRPPYSLPISRTEKDPEKLYEVYEIGRKTAMENLEDIRKFLA